MWEEAEAVIRENLQSLHKLLKKTDTESFLYKATTSAEKKLESNCWSQWVSSHRQQRALDQAVDEQAHECMNIPWADVLLSRKHHLHTALPTSGITREIYFLNRHWVICPSTVTGIHCKGSWKIPLSGWPNFVCRSDGETNIVKLSFLCRKPIPNL